MIEWTDLYATGNDTIDSQHKELFSFINNFHLSETKEELVASIMALYQYTRYHFKFEERTMIELNYPDIAKHLEQHNALIDMLNEVSMNVANGSLVKFQADTFIDEWVGKHIPVEDVKLAAYINKK